MIAILFTFFFLQSSDANSPLIIESAIGEFKDAETMSIIENGDIVVIDRKTSKLFHRNSKSGEMNFFGGIGWGNYEFDDPVDVWSSFLFEIYVTDKNNHRIQKYDKASNFIQTIDENSFSKLEGRFYPLACATSSQGDLFVIESDGHRIIKINQRHQIEKEIGTFRDGEGALTQPLDISVAGDDNLFVLDNSSVKVFDRYGNFVKTIPLSPGNHWKRIQSSVDRITVTSSTSILIFDFDGALLQSIPKTSIMGLNPNEELRDAIISSNRVLLLTSTTLYRCTFP